MKRPSFQFYPSDWLRDTALRTCSVGARGLWMDMICYMHEGSPYGYLKVNNKVILPLNLARMVGLTLDETEGYLSELKDAGVYEVDEDGSIFSKRMIRDENLRNKRAEGGKLGGNPKLKDMGKVILADNLKVNHEDKQNTTPSSSSSSSSSIDIHTGTKSPSVPFEKIANLFNETLPELPSIKLLTDTRKKAIKARWLFVQKEEKYDDEQTLDWFKRYFEWIKQSKFLTGSSKDWRADFDFIMNPSKFTKIIEGAYHKEQQS